MYNLLNFGHLISLVDEEGNPVLDENGNPIPLPPPEPDPPKDEETYMEIALPFFGIYIKKYNYLYTISNVYIHNINSIVKFFNTLLQIMFLNITTNHVISKCYRDDMQMMTTQFILNNLIFSKF